MNEKVTIDSNIPIPVVRGRWSKYPWSDLRPGQSFLVTETDGNVYLGLRSYALSYSKKIGGGLEFTVRKHDGGFRVWRIK